MIDAAVLEGIREEVAANGYTVVDEDLNRPWGGFLRLDEAQATQFIEHYFPDLQLTEIQYTLPKSPKYLMVAPEARLSLQQHERRSEIWRVKDGPVGVVKTVDANEAEVRVLQTGDEIQIRQGEIHRLVGQENWGVVVEIWVHEDPNHPSDESDIVRLQDDYSRA